MASDALWVVSFKCVVKGYKEYRSDVKDGEVFKVLKKIGEKGRAFRIANERGQFNVRASEAGEACQADVRGISKHARHLKTREAQTLNSSPFPFYWLFVRLLALFRSTRGEFFPSIDLTLKN